MPLKFNLGKWKDIYYLKVTEDKPSSDPCKMLKEQKSPIPHIAPGSPRRQSGGRAILAYIRCLVVPTIKENLH